MTQPSFHKSKTKSQPIYSRVWQRLQQFPQVLAEGSPHPVQVSGVAAAALVSAGFGCFLMMVIHHLSDTSKEFETLVWALGSWIPGSHNPSKLYGNIGSYSGKETTLLLGWLTSWVVLSRLWQHKQIRPKTIFFWFAAFFVAATAMSWHPLFPYLPLM